ncbi:MAG: hypothetical protein RR336_05215, partial [Oscillospiraceae bacterium]
YGISDNKSTPTTNCFWLQSKDFNANLTEGAGTKTTAADLKKKNMGDKWAANGNAPSYPDKNTGNFPYPSLKALDHYGDWPMVERTGRVGAAVGGYCYTEFDYRANGQYVNRADSSQVTAFDNKTYQFISNTVLVFFESTEDTNEWTVTYNGKNQSLSAYNRTVVNMPTGLKAYQLFPAPTLLDGRKLELSKEDESYTFTYNYKKSTFTYDSPTP